MDAEMLSTLDISAPMETYYFPSSPTTHRRDTPNASDQPSESLALLIPSQGLFRGPSTSNRWSRDSSALPSSIYLDPTIIRPVSPLYAWGPDAGSSEGQTRSTRSSRSSSLPLHCNLSTGPPSYASLRSSDTDF